MPHWVSATRLPAANKNPLEITKVTHSESSQMNEKILNQS
jgi:hypothetical protein